MSLSFSDLQKDASDHHRHPPSHSANVAPSTGTREDLRWQDFTQQVELHLPGYTVAGT